MILTSNEARELIETLRAPTPRTRQAAIRLLTQRLADDPVVRFETAIAQMQSNDREDDETKTEGAPQ